MKIKTLGTIEVLACGPLQAYGTEDQQKTKEGQPLFEIAYKTKQKVRVGDQEVETDSIEKCKSIIDLKAGLHDVEVIQFHMSDKGSSQVKTYTRIVDLVKKQK